MDALEKWYRDVLDALAPSERLTVVAILTEGRTPEKLTEVADNARACADTLTRTFLEKLPPSRPIACKEGCAWCCRLHVTLTVPEVIAIADYLRATLPATELESLKARVTELDQETHGLNPWQRARTGLPCALLVEGRCSVYPVRPLACRGWNSYDAARCEQGVLALQAYGPQLYACSTVRLGMRQGLGQAGLSGADLELTAALRIALENPDVAKQYLAQEPVFAEARAVSNE
jgi:Fe-S-cluster containining protein